MLQGRGGRNITGQRPAGPPPPPPSQVSSSPSLNIISAKSLMQFHKKSENNMPLKKSGGWIHSAYFQK